MKKQIVFLYILLFAFLGLFGYAGFMLFTMETEPEVPEAYVAYQEIQEEVSLETDPGEEESYVYIDFDLQELLKINPAFDSWLMIPDTSISYPVVYPQDNFTYLYWDFSKKNSVFGCLYYDVFSVPGAQNRVIHGHNMGVNRKEMFSPLVLFQEQDYAEAHKYAYLGFDSEIPAEEYELFAVFNFNLASYPSFDYAKPNFDAEEERAEFAEFFQDRSIYQTDFVPEGDLLILSTCNRQFGQTNRLLICYGKTNNEQTPVLK